MTTQPTSEMIEAVAEQLQPSDVAAMQKLANHGPEGYWTNVWLEPRDPNPITLLIIHRKFPELLTCFSEDEDPAGTRVTLTEFGKAVLERVSKSIAND